MARIEIPKKCMAILGRATMFIAVLLAAHSAPTQAPPLVMEGTKAQAPQRAVPSPSAPGGPAASGRTASRNTEGLSADGNILLDYEERPLIDIIKSLGALTGKNFYIDPKIPKESVTIISHKEIPPDMAYAVLESILASQNVEMVPSLDGNLIKLVPTAEVPEKRPLVLRGDEVPGGHDTWVTYLVDVQYADATEIKDLIKPLGSKTSVVVAYAPTNTLIITDVIDGVRNMLRLLEQIDLPGYNTEQEIFQLKFTRAEVIATQIQEVLNPEGQTGQPRGRPTPAAPGQQAAPAVQRRTTIPGQQPSATVGSREQVLRIVADERMNALIVVASAPMMEQVRDLIDKLDSPTAYESNNMHVYALQNADAEKVAETLNALTGTAPRESGAAGGAPGAGAGGGGGAPAGEVQPFEKKVQITTYTQSNMLLIIASPLDYKLIEEIIARLDVPQRQVHVEAVILDVIINDSYTLSVEAAGLTANDAFALSNVVRLANIIATGPLAAAGPGATIGIIDGTTQVPISDGAGGFVVQEIPNVPLLINALENMTNLDILSQPSLTTVDNEESNIIVGQEVPFVAGGTRQADQTSVGSNFFSTRVDRKDVGIKLRVTPQISEGDNVFLDLEVEVSSVIASPVGADVNIVGPTLQKSNVTNKMVIKDGSTGIMGGLISESTDRSRVQTPIVGDLPLVGWLFRNKGDRRNKRNLVVLVTPYIVKESPEFDRVTDYRTEEFEAANVDALFQKGYIKKIKAKHEVRNHHSPAQNRLNTMDKAGAFEKGGLEVKEVTPQ